MLGALQTINLKKEALYGFFLRSLVWLFPNKPCMAFSFVPIGPSRQSKGTRGYHCDEDISSCITFVQFFFLNNHVPKLIKNTPLIPQRGGGGGGEAVVQSVERATPGEEVPGSTPAVAACFLLVGSVSV